MIICCVVFYFIFLVWLEVLIFKIDDDIMWVVDNGKCSDDVIKIVNVDDKLVVVLFVGCIFIILLFIVLIIF